MPHSSLNPASIVVVILVVAWVWKLLSAPSDRKKKHHNFYTKSGRVSKHYSRWPR